MSGGLLSRLIASVSPRSDNYFALFNELAACTVRGAKILAKMSSVHDPAAFDQLFVEMTKTEGEADEVTKTIFLSLHKTFITPFDRWEIKDLAMALDDMIDYMEDIPTRQALRPRRIHVGNGGARPDCTACHGKSPGSRRIIVRHEERRAHSEDMPGNRRD